jgi:hypothetical protein
MTEDEAFKEAEARIANAPKVVAALHAVTEAQKFIEEHTATELGITTLRKAFEMGFRQGYYDALKDRK